MKLLRRIIFILIITLVSLFALAVIFISPIAKWAIEKYSVEYTGRQINMDKLYINLFTGNINTKGFKIYEEKSNKIFYQCDEMRVGVTLHKLFIKEYEITEVTLNTPTVYVIQHGKKFNFSDLIKRFSTPPPAKPEPKGAPAHWYVKKFNISNATVVYITDLPANKLQLIHGNIGISDLAWNNPKYSVKINFGLASGGTVDATSTFNLDTYLYHVSLDIEKFNVSPFYVYLKDYLRVNSLDGLITTQLSISGNMHKATEIATSGKLTIADFSIIDNTNDKLVAFKSMNMSIDSVNTAQNIYKFNSITMLEPYLKFEMYTDGYNFDRLSTTPPSKTVDTAATVVYANIFQMISGYVQSITENYVVSNYNADKLSIQNGEVYFTDYTLPQKFTYHFDQLNAVSDRVSSNKEKISIVADCRLNSSGHMNGVINVNPKNFKDFDMDFNVKDMHMRDFNPYSKFYVATPFVTGSVQYHNITSVAGGKLKSSNTLTIYQLKAGKTDNSYKPQYKLPIRLAVALLTDRHGNVTLDIPVEGDLNNPKFKWGKVIWHVLGTLIVKAATAPFRMLAGLFGGSEKDYKQLDFEYAQATLNTDQQKQLSQIAKIAVQKPGVKIEMSQTTDINNEKEKIAENLVKQRYLGFGDTLTDDQQQKIASLNVNDSLFVKYIDSILVTPKAQSSQEKCMQIVGPQKLEVLFVALEQQRNTEVLNYLLQAGAPKDRISIMNSPKPFDPALGDNPKYVINMAVADGTTAGSTDKKSD
jgi:hypothetical protein